MQKLFLLVAVIFCSGFTVGNNSQKWSNAVEVKRTAIIKAAKNHDVQALSELAGPGEFHYTYKNASLYGFWNSLDKKDTEILSKIMEMNHSNINSEYIWPQHVIDRKHFSASPEMWDELLATYGYRYNQAVDKEGYYIGWRVHITPDGRWTHFSKNKRFSLK